jgi:hypothetical protein
MQTGAMAGAEIIFGGGTYRYHTRAGLVGQSMTAILTVSPRRR